MVGKTPESIIAVRPLKDGVIADFDTVEMMLHYFIRKVHTQRMMAPHPRVVIGIPSGVTEVEKRAAKDAALSAGAREAYTIEEPMAAAIGAGLADQRAGRQHDRRHRRWHDRSCGHLARRHRRQPLDPGGGGRDRRRDHPVRPAGPQPGHRRAHGREREDRSRLRRTRSKKRSGSTLRGRDLLTGLPKSVEISSVELREAISPPVNTIVELVKTAIEETPPELVADIMEQGITLAGGGALLLGLDRRLAERAARCRCIPGRGSADLCRPRNRPRGRSAPSL